MLSVPRPSIKKNLYKLEKYMRTAATRKGTCARLAQELGVTEQAVRNAASKYGITGFRSTFSDHEEEMLVCACLVYARQGTPLTKRDFALLATKFSGRKDGKVFS